SWCFNGAISVFPCADEIMQQEIRPLVAVDIIEQLHRQFAILSGGRGKDGAPIITFPEFAGFSEIPDDDFLNVVTYLTSIPSFASPVRGCLEELVPASGRSQIYLGPMTACSLTALSMQLSFC
uniref:MCF.2 cell line derived transforming sequence-like 2 n=1 Tax=Malurus cyaneus samueli TaxID=2593467 RepID=A0A8C5T3H2_9PASS